MAVLCVSVFTIFIALIAATGSVNQPKQHNFAFDKDTSDWSIYCPQGAKASVSWDSQTGKTKAGSARLISESDEGVFVYSKISRIELVESATGYEFKSWVKTDGNIDAWLEVKFVDNPDSGGFLWEVNSKDYENQTPPLIYSPIELYDGQWRLLKIKIPVFELCSGQRASAAEMHIVAKGRGTLWLDDVSYKPYTYEALTELAHSSHRTAIRDASGKPAAIVLAPDDPFEAKAAKNLANLLNIPWRNEPKFRRPLPNYPVDGIEPSTNLILVSTGVGGPITQALRRATWIREDQRIPGKGGYIIRTIARPFRSTANVIAISAGDAESLEQACSIFAKNIRLNGNSEYHKFLVIEPSREWRQKRDSWYEAPHDGEYFKQIRRYGNGGSSRGWCLNLLQLANRYYLTGDDEYAKVYRQSIMQFGYPATNDDHMGLHALIFSWDYIEESPVFSPQERLKITNDILGAMDGHQGYGMRMIFKAAQYNHPLRLRHNHWMILANGLMGGYLYFDRHYGLERASEWKAWAEDTAINCVAWGGPEDSAHYQVRAFVETARHWRYQGLSSKSQPGTETFTNYANLIVAIRDNAGLLAAFGDSSLQAASYVPFEMICGNNFDHNFYHDHELEFLKYMAQDWDFSLTQFYYDNLIAKTRDSRKNGYNVFDNLPSHFGRFHIGVDPLGGDFIYQFGSSAVGGPSWIPAPQVSDDAMEFVGMRRFMREPEYYDWRAGGFIWYNTHKFPLFKPTWVPPYDDTFDKIVYRSGFELEDEYIAIDGLGEDIDHGHFDLGNIFRYMVGGRIWITDQGYFHGQRRYHCVPEVFRNGYPDEKTLNTYEQEPIVIKEHFSKWPAMAQLLELVPDVSSEIGEFNIKFTVKDLSGSKSQWIRHVKGGNGKPMEIIDTITALEGGNFEIVWRLPLLANEIKGDRAQWQAIQNGVMLPIKLSVIEGDTVEVVKLVEYNKDRNTYERYYWYPYVDHFEGPTTIQWARRFTWKKGQHTTFRAILGPPQRD